MAELGKKHECVQCGGKFYDLGKSDPVCPKCGSAQTEQPEDEALKERPSAKVEDEDEGDIDDSSFDEEDDEESDEEDDGHDDLDDDQD